MSHQSNMVNPNSLFGLQEDLRAAGQHNANLQRKIEAKDQELKLTQAALARANDELNRMKLALRNQINSSSHILGAV